MKGGTLDETRSTRTSSSVSATNNDRTSAAIRSRGRSALPGVRSGWYQSTQCLRAGCAVQLSISAVVQWCNASSAHPPVPATGDKRARRAARAVRSREKRGAKSSSPAGRRARPRARDTHSMPSAQWYGTMLGSSATQTGPPSSGNSAARQIDVASTSSTPVWPRSAHQRVYRR